MYYGSLDEIKCDVQEITDIRETNQTEFERHHPIRQKNLEIIMNRKLVNDNVISLPVLDYELSNTGGVFLVALGNKAVNLQLNNFVFDGEILQIRLPFQNIKPYGEKIKVILPYATEK